MVSEQTSNSGWAEGAVSEHELRQPYLEAINRPLLAHLGNLADGAVIVDLACGIGDPTLQVAAEFAIAERVIGIDADDAALTVARRRARAAGLANVDFQTMTMDKLVWDDDGVDAVVSRLGALLFGDSESTALELARVLERDAPFSLALWSDVDANPYMRLGLGALGDVLPADELPNLNVRFEPLRQSDVVEGWLRDAGLRAVDSELFTWDVTFANFESWWLYNTQAGPLGPLFGGLND